MSPADAALAAALAVLAYVHVGYPALVGALALRRRAAPPELPDAQLPTVAVVVAAYDEEAVIADKIRDCLALDYPRDRLSVWVVSDGSRDRTPEIAASFPEVRALHQPARRGKLAAVDRAVAAIDAEIVVATDANTFVAPGALRAMARHFADPRVGVVSGEKRVIARGDGGGVVEEGAYWRYEAFLKRSESALGAVIGSAGELFAVRRDLWRTPPHDTILDDFVLSMDVVVRGYRNLYEPSATATEAASATTADEAERRSRIAAGGWQAMARHPHWLHPRLGFAAFAYLSHRVLRWAAAPPALFLTPALALASAAAGSAFGAAIAATCGGAALGVALAPEAKVARLLQHAVLAHAAALRGAWRWAVAGQPVTWARVAR